MNDIVVAGLGLLAYTVAVVVLTAAALYLIARDMDPPSEDAAHERTRMDLW